MIVLRYLFQTCLVLSLGIPIFTAKAEVTFGGTFAYLYNKYTGGYVHESTFYYGKVHIRGQKSFSNNNALGTKNAGFHFSFRTHSHELQRFLRLGYGWIDTSYGTIVIGGLFSASDLLHIPPYKFPWENYEFLRDEQMLGFDAVNFYDFYDKSSSTLDKKAFFSSYPMDLSMADKITFLSRPSDGLQFGASLTPDNKYFGDGNLLFEEKFPEETTDTDKLYDTRHGSIDFAVRYTAPKKESTRYLTNFRLFFSSSFAFRYKKKHGDTNLKAPYTISGGFGFLINNKIIRKQHDIVLSYKRYDDPLGITSDTFSAGLTFRYYKWNTGVVFMRKSLKNRHTSVTQAKNYWLAMGLYANYEFMKEVYLTLGINIFKDEATNASLGVGANLKHYKPLGMGRKIGTGDAADQAEENFINLYVGIVITF